MIAYERHSPISAALRELHDEALESMSHGLWAARRTLGASWVPPAAALEVVEFELLVRALSIENLFVLDNYDFDEILSIVAGAVDGATADSAWVNEHKKEIAFCMASAFHEVAMRTMEAAAELRNERK